MTTVGPTDPPPPEPTPGRNRFEDFEVPTPQAAPRRRHRPAVLTTAVIVLVVSGVLNGLFVVLFHPGGAAAWALAVLALLQLVAAAGVLLLRSAGRTLGFAMAAIGIVLGLVRAPAGAASALMSIALNAFVIYALVAAGPAFDRG